MDRKVTKGNVFKDLGFTDEEAIALAKSSRQKVLTHYKELH